MSRVPCRILPILFILSAGLAVHAQDAAQVMKDLTSEEAAVRSQAFQSLLALGDRGVESLLTALVEPGKGDASAALGGADAGARFGLCGLATRYGAPGGDEAKRVGFVGLLAKYLAGEAPAATKQFAISQLQVCGGKEAVPALAACLPNADLAEYASRALAANSSTESLKALRDSLGAVQGPSRVSVIQALGERRDGAATPLLLPLLKTNDAAIRLAAIEALGRIGDPKAEPALAACLGQGSDRERRAIFDAYVTLGDQLAATGKRPEALKVFATALKAAPTDAAKCAALAGIGKVGSAKDVPAVMASLADPSPAVRHTAQRCLVELPDPKVAEAVAQAMKGASPGEKGGLLRVLAERKEAAATQAIEAAAQDPSAEVRVVAYQLLDRLADPALEPTLLEAAQKGSAAIKPVALEAYLRLADARREKERDAALAMYTKALDLAPSDALRRAALNGMASVAGEESLAKVEPCLANDALKQEALRAYVAIASRLADAGQRERATEMLKKAVGLGPSRDVMGSAIAKLRDLGINLDPAKAAGFVTTWWVMGPWPAPEIDTKRPPEDGVDLKAKVRIDDQEVAWQKHHTTDAMGDVNLDAMLKPNDSVTAYMYAEVTVPQEQDVLFRTGSDDALKVFLNGKEVFKFASPRSLQVDQDTIKAHLNAGVNQVLLKVVDWGGGWEACLRVTDRNGKPIEFQQKED